MQRRLAFAGVLGVLAIAATQGVAGAAQPATPTFRDSAVGTGGTSVFSAFDFDVSGGPTGENATGFSTVDGFGEHFVASSTICLQVNGNTATFAGALEPNGFGIPYGKVTVVDNGPANSGLDTYAAAGYFSPPTCDAPLTGGGTVQPGDVVVTDSPPPPTSRSQCMGGGYAGFGFANEGLCTAYVERPGA